MSVSPEGTVAALAGRRPDPLDAHDRRFPLEHAAAVRVAIDSIFDRDMVHTLISSAACGADLLALEAALDRGLRCRIILPFEPAAFRRTSVVDRPGDWGTVFDRVIAHVHSDHDIVVLDGEVGAASAYREVTRRIVSDAVAIAAPAFALAIVVWDGQPRDGVDATEEFRQLAIESGLIERTVLTGPT